MEKKDYSLTYDFSDRVMAQINREVIIREKRRDTLIIVASVLGSVLGVVATIFILTYYEIISNPFGTFSFLPIATPSFSAVFTEIQRYGLFIIVGINMVVLYILGERLAIGRNIGLRVKE